MNTRAIIFLSIALTRITAVLTVPLCSCIKPNFLLLVFGKVINLKLKLIDVDVLNNDKQNVHAHFECVLSQL